MWVNCAERMPRNGGYYFARGHGGMPFVCILRDGDKWWRNSGSKRVFGITHWMPVPPVEGEWDSYSTREE